MFYVIGCFQTDYGDIFTVNQITFWIYQLSGRVRASMIWTSFHNSRKSYTLKVKGLVVA